MERAPRYTCNELAAILDAQGRRRDWLATQVGVHKALITHLINGRRTVSHEIAERICLVLGVPFFVAFKLSDESNSPSVELASREAIPA
jgi:plasmid maintenance system antidote protein VapI